MYIDTNKGPIKVESVKVMMGENEKDESFLMVTLENGAIESHPISSDVAEILIGTGMESFGSDEESRQAIKDTLLDFLKGE